MAQEDLATVLAPVMSGMDEHSLREYLATIWQRAEVERERLQHMTDVDWHVREAERRRQALVERQARRAAARTADEVRRHDRSVRGAEVCYSYAQRWLQQVRDDPAAYAERMTAHTQAYGLQLQQCVDIIEARLEELERQRKEEELRQSAQLKQRTTAIAGKAEVAAICCSHVN